MKKITRILSLTLFLFALRVLNAYAEPAGETEIIFDASGSMNESKNNVVKLDMAKEALTTIAGQIPTGSNVGLRIFGSTPVTGNASESCEDSKLIFSISGFQKDAMVQNVSGLKSYGMTALGHSLELAGKDFSAGQDVKKNIILISDGEETCGKDPIGVMEALKAQGIQIVIHAIGFSASDAGKAQLKKLSEITGGSYREAEDAVSLKTSLAQSVQQTVLLQANHEASGENILSAANGARIVSSSNENYAKLIDGKEDEVSLNTGDEIVFSFKDNQPVSLTAFQVPIFEAHHWNLADLKLYGSTENPNSGFFKVADIKVENKVDFSNVYQNFKIDPPQPIRYLKVVIGKRPSGESNPFSHEWKAQGKYLTEEELKAIPKKDINLLFKENGGQFIGGSQMNYAKLVDGTNDGFGERTSITLGDEAIFGFKDGKTAALTKIGVTILEANSENIKTLEIFVSETSPSGPYTSMGTFETSNMVFAQNLVQEYIFQKPVKAKYLKVKFANSYDGKYCHSDEILAMGHLE